MSIQSDISFMQWCARFARRHPRLVDEALYATCVLGFVAFGLICFYIGWGAA